MRIVIIGAGFSGLTAAYRLLQAGHTVSVIEKAETLGGLATGYTHRGWKWRLDKAYHHLFTNDYSAIELAKEIGQKLIHITPKTCVLAHGEIIPFDSPLTLLTFPFLSNLDKLRTAATLLYLKIVNDYAPMEGVRATEWIKRWMGQGSYQTIWEPLFRGKFGQLADSVMLPWFWARIKKRTQSLYYPEGGFSAFLDLLAQRVQELGGEITLSATVSRIHKRKAGGYNVEREGDTTLADQVLYTGPTPGFPFLFGQALKPARKAHQYLTAQILVLRLKKPLLENAYWLNVTEAGYPFLVVVDHTNFVSPRYYNGEHIVYIGNYLPPDHPYLDKARAQLLKLFDPYIDRIKPGYRKSLIGYDVFALPYAQAVVDSDYVANMHKKGTGLKGVYMINIDSVYPWDRGTNYAIEKGEEIARIIQNARSL